MSVVAMILIGCLQSDAPRYLRQIGRSVIMQELLASMWVLTTVATSGENNPLKVYCYIIKAWDHLLTRLLNKSHYFIRLLIYAA